MIYALPIHLFCQHLAEQDNVQPSAGTYWERHKEQYKAALYTAWVPLLFSLPFICSCQVMCLGEQRPCVTIHFEHTYSCHCDRCNLYRCTAPIRLSSSPPFLDWHGGGWLENATVNLVVVCDSDSSATGYTVKYLIEMGKNIL